MKTVNIVRSLMRGLGLAAVLLGITRTGTGDIVITKSGTQYAGTVVDAGDQVIVQSRQGVFVIERRIAKEGSHYDSVTTTGGARYVGIITENADGVTVETPATDSSTPVRRTILKKYVASINRVDTVASIRIDTATQMKPVTEAEVKASQDAAQRAKEEAAKAHAKEEQAKATEKEVLNDRLTSLNASIAALEHRKQEVQTRIDALTAQGNADIATADWEYRNELSIPHPDRQDGWVTVALQARDSKVANIRAQYGSKIAEQRATLDTCNRDLSDSYASRGRIIQKMNGL
jgi:hypothetical protein